MRGLRTAPVICWRSVWAWCLPSFVLSEDLVHVIFTYFQCRCGEEGSCRRCEWCFFKPAVEFIQIVCQLLILQSAGGCCLVIGDVFQTFPQWSRITGRSFVRTSLKQSMRHQWFNRNFMRLQEYLLCAKKTKIIIFINFFSFLSVFAISVLLMQQKINCQYLIS